MDKINYFLITGLIKVIRDFELKYELNVKQKDDNLIMTLDVKGYQQLKIERSKSSLIINDDLENQIENINYLNKDNFMLKLDYLIQNLKPDDNLNNKTENSDLLLG